MSKKLEFPVTLSMTVIAQVDYDETKSLEEQLDYWENMEEGKFLSFPMHIKRNQANGDVRRLLAVHVIEANVVDA